MNIGNGLPTTKPENFLEFWQIFKFRFKWSRTDLTNYVTKNCTKIFLKFGGFLNSRVLQFFLFSRSAQILENNLSANYEYLQLLFEKIKIRKYFVFQFEANLALEFDICGI